MSAECICYPCTTPARGAPWLDHCAACCYGTLIQEYHHDCPVGDHAAMAVRQFGPIVAASSTATATTEEPLGGTTGPLDAL